MFIRKPIAQVQRDTNNAKRMLQMWKTSYMDTRQKIENSGKGQRWEFSKQKLFAATEYMANVCLDLNEVATVRKF